MSAAKSMDRVLEGLIAQKKLCGGEKCRRPRCRRCVEGRAYRARVDGGVA